MPVYLTRFITILFWLFISLITFLLLVEQNTSPPIFPYADKVIHAIIFAALTFVGYFAYTKYQNRLYWGIVIYGAVIEVLQGVYTQTRHASIGDWIANIIGVLLCVILIHLLNPISKPYVR